MSDEMKSELRSLFLTVSIVKALFVAHLKRLAHCSHYPHGLALRQKQQTFKHPPFIENINTEEFINIREREKQKEENDRERENITSMSQFHIIAVLSM